MSHLRLNNGISAVVSEQTSLLRLNNGIFTAVPEPISHLRLNNSISAAVPEQISHLCLNNGIFTAVPEQISHLCLNNGTSAVVKVQIRLFKISPIDENHSFLNSSQRAAAECRSSLYFVSALTLAALSKPQEGHTAA
ncbi:hypothetical protein [Paenibacillus sp. HW567]|uniref:hypothetical protein n=1 Tax=Paenibacillus sp. HW567 TaxID=1034769 RepID=UPI0012EC0ADD|nr:hypothetical protein [Paenibacillus sp. HW567]